MHVYVFLYTCYIIVSIWCPQEEAREAQRAAEAALERMREEYEAKER